MTAGALVYNEVRYRGMWDRLAPAATVEVLRTRADSAERIRRPGACASIVEAQVAADAIGIRIVILNEKGQLIEKISPEANPPIGVTRPARNFEGIVLRLDKNHYEWAKVRC